MDFEIKNVAMKKQNVRTLSLIVCTFTYLLVGAAVFDALESEKERVDKAKLEREEMLFRQEFDIPEEAFGNISRVIHLNVPYKAGIQWKFAGAFYFALTVITVIGYGHSTPGTKGGKIFCMFYALLGIPLCLVMFQSIGERLNTFITFLIKNIKRCLKLKKTEVSQTDLILVGGNLVSVVLLAGAAAFKSYEDWEYLNAVYYCFITLTTIGFGDFVALQKQESLQKRPEYVAFALIFILFGLTVVSAAMNLLILRFLTMNTEDERKDELQALEAARTAVRLEGDVITANGSVISGAQELPELFHDNISVCSCTCYNFPGLTGHSKKQARYSVTRSPGKIQHLLHSFRNGLPSMKQTDNADVSDDNCSEHNFEMLKTKRASI